PVEPPVEPAGDRDVLVVEPDLVEPDLVEPEVVVEPEPVRPASLRDRLAKARAAFAGAFAGVRGRSTITDETWDDLEESLLRADVGLGVTEALLDDLKARVEAKEVTEPGVLLDALRAEMVSRLAGADRALGFEAFAPGEPNVWLFVGVNGVGKTTTIGK